MSQSVIIIGGGVLGLSCAWSLAQRGCSVTVLEKNTIGSGASGANLGQISLMDRTEAWHAEAVFETLEFYEKLQEEFDLEYEQTGGTAVLMDELQWECANRAAEKGKSAGIRIEFLRKKEALLAEPNLSPNAIEGVAFCREEGKINPLLVTRAFYRLALRNGVQIHDRTEVKSFDVMNGIIHSVHTNRGSFAADVVMIAAGSWTAGIGALAGVGIPLGYHRGTAYVSLPVHRMMKGPVVGGGLFVTGMGGHPESRHIALCGIQSRTGSLVIGQATENAEPDDRDISAQGLTLTAQKFLNVFPSMKNIEIVRAWSASTPFSQDELPMFGFASSISNLFVTAGFKGAFSTAFSVGRHAADSIFYGSKWENEQFVPDRRTKGN